jgi:hypothetical protein
LFLKLILNWPESFLTWDILFPLPMVWVGPVIAPVILSLLMIAWTFILYGLSKNKTFRINPVEWVLMISGALMSIVTFTKDYFAFAKSKGAMQLAEKSHEYIPGEFDWFLFSISLALILLSMIFYVYRVSRTRRALQMQQLY